MKVLVALLSLLSCVVATAKADDALYSALQMQSDCKPFEQAVVSDNGNRIAFQRTFATGQCWAAFSIIQTYGHIGWPHSAQTILRTCLPPTSTRLELIQVFLRYIDQHPELDHAEGALVAVKALHQAYPCRGRNQ